MILQIVLLPVHRHRLANHSLTYIDYSSVFVYDNYHSTSGLFHSVRVIEYLAFAVYLIAHIFNFSVYFPLCLHRKSAMFDFL